MNIATIHHLLINAAIAWGAVSGWWTPVCVMLGVLYAWLMYRQPINLGLQSRYLLAGMRAVAVFLIAFLLISPLVKSVTYQPQKPLLLIAQDNSTSVKDFKPKGFNESVLIEDLSELKSKLGSDYDVREFNFGDSLSNGLNNGFNGRKTNIAAAIRQLKDRYANQNIGALVLATDGLYNQGSDPQYEARNLKTNIYTIALGDTIPRRDLLISNVSYNKTALLGNDFMIEVLTEAYQSNGETLRLSVWEDGRQVYSQSIVATSGAFRKVWPVKLNADQKGIHQFTVKLVPIDNELSVHNNTESVFIEVLDARQKILLAYAGPHPDIRVIKQSIEQNKNYELKTVQAADLPSIKPAEFDLVILYQMMPPPSLEDYLTKSKVPVWYFAGAQTNLAHLNKLQGTVTINTTRSEMQEVFASPTNGFTLFTLSDSTLNKIGRMPPLLAPFANYGTSATASALLKQRIGNVSTSYPLIAFDDASGRRIAVLTGERLWRWQLAEYQTYSNHHALEELFGQSIQYLTANANRQRFSAYPAKNAFDEGENVLFNAELYNDALELVNTPDVSLVLKNEAGKIYNYLFSRNAKSYQLNAGMLPIGNYSYTAKAALGRQPFAISGKFIIKALKLESRQSTANHRLLYSMAKESGGVMLQPSEVDRLVNLIRKNENIRTVVYNNDHYSDLIDIKWFFVLIVGILSAEWVLRKREGQV